jgi:hypothetical protein
MRIFLKTEVFLSVLVLRPHVNGVYGNRKRRFSKTLSRVEVFENAVFVFSCGRAKTKVSKTMTWWSGPVHTGTRVLYMFSRWRTRSVWYVLLPKNGIHNHGCNHLTYSVEKLNFRTLIFIFLTYLYFLQFPLSFYDDKLQFYCWFDVGYFIANILKDRPTYPLPIICVYWENGTSKLVTRNSSGQKIALLFYFLYSLLISGI